MYDVELPLVDASLDFQKGLQLIKKAKVGALIVRGDHQYALVHAVGILSKPTVRLADSRILGSSMLFSGKTSPVPGSLNFSVFPNLVKRFANDKGRSDEPDFLIEPLGSGSARVRTPYKYFVTVLSGADGWVCTGPARHPYVPPPSRTEGEPCEHEDGGVLVRAVF